MSVGFKSVGVIGATGFIGRALAGHLSSEGFEVVRFCRQPPEGEHWRAIGGDLDLRGLDAVVNLAGEPIAQRWSCAAWANIHESRVGLTRSIVRAMQQMDPAERPAVLLNASAVGIYPSSGNEEMREEEEPGTGRLAVLCRDWEAAAVEAEGLGVRVVPLRTGIVLGKGGEAWERLRMLFRVGLGGRLGSGRQWMPWIHLEDQVAAIAFALQQDDLHGPLNLCAPEPVTNREFTNSLARALHRPAFCHAPRFALRLMLGGFGEEGLLASCRALPARLIKLGFEFNHANLKDALAELVGEEGSRSSKGEL